MRQILTIFLVAVGLSAAASAQQSHGYLFIAPGGISSGGHTATTVHLGAGGEVGLAKGVGLGAELGALGPRQDFAGNLMGVVSANGYYHFRREEKLEPFVTAGYSLFFRSGHANLFNFGGGANYWFHSKLGLRLEFRDHVWSQSRSPPRTGGAFASASLFDRRRPWWGYL